MMISVPIDGGVFNYRAGVIIVDRDHVLLCRVQGYEVWFLPGGRCELMETSIETIKREIREELASACEVTRLVWIVENFFPLNGVRFHEIGLYYLVELPPNSRLFGTDQPRPFLEAGGTTMETHWFPIAGLEQINLQPAFLRQSLAEIPATPCHRIVRDDLSGL